MNGAFPFFLGLYLLCLVIRNTYELFKKAGRVNLKSKPLFAAIFGAMILLWLCYFAMCPIDPWKLQVQPGVAWGGFAVFLTGWALALGALLQLKGLEDIDHLVTGGLFRRLRHPMYAGFIFWIVGWGIFHGSLASLLAGCLGIASILHWRELEERALELRYGEQYRLYRRTTWF